MSVTVVEIEGRRHRLLKRKRKGPARGDVYVFEGDGRRYMGGCVLCDHRSRRKLNPTEFRATIGDVPADWLAYGP